ncbi:bifunctional 2-polyprenyl-6-hydroxyphenol methylase/3-demethylubiquinol 3-O-methyltransferase UbiG [Brachybacterium sp. FME24]|uniref:class I SAM-dependent methyltransferase n=1 Tax=Brachybacterium sp. FME24 TaxID=2742605 RepID=UPI001867E6B0|nr:methyltransferase domain-containing protein [Brachybacterium sp. FME24]
MDWDERYAKHGRPFGDEPNEFVAWAITDGPLAAGLVPGARILCPGDGYGRHGIWLAERGHRVLGIDLSQTATRDARRRAAETPGDYTAITADLSGEPYPVEDGRQFEAIVAVWFRLPQLAARTAWNRAATGHLLPRGRILVVTGAAVTSAEAEIAEWPPVISWSDHSTAREIRLLGELLD